MATGQRFRFCRGGEEVRMVETAEEGGRTLKSGPKRTKRHGPWSFGMGWGLPRLWYCELDWTTGTADHLLGVAEGTTEQPTGSGASPQKSSHRLNLA